jgi:hypothetical protein
MPRLTPPTRLTFFIGLFFFVIGLAGQFAPQIVGAIPYSATPAYFAIAYLVLFFGNLIRGI